MIRINIINCFILLTGQAILLAVTDALHDVIETEIRYGPEVIKLKWKRTEQYLANSHLPVWSAFEDHNPELLLDVMDQVGPFVLYHDVEHTSAVAYFGNSNALFGIIDTRFYINGLPLDQTGPTSYHEIGGFYVKARYANPDFGYFHDFNIKSTKTDDEMLSMNCRLRGYGCPFGYQEPLDLSTPRFVESTDPEYPILYPEILVFVANDIVENMEYQYPYTFPAILVSQYIIYFNSVDMLFQKLTSKSKNLKIHLNIAGIVMESEADVFSITYAEETFDYINATSTLLSFSDYIKKYDYLFVEDSFDFFFLSSKFELHRDDYKVAGISKTGNQVYNSRAWRLPYMGLSGSLVQQNYAAGDYVVASHEIAHLMSVSHDPPEEKCHGNSVQCYAIMQEQGNFCRHCTKWSRKSIKEIEKYARKSTNKCFLLNHPRSLYTYGRPIRGLEPGQQCNCYGYDTHYPYESFIPDINGHTCDRDLKCINSKKRIVGFPIPLPMDGTPCGKDMVCWQKKCYRLTL